jgi:hypothetical protein
MDDVQKVSNCRQSACRQTWTSGNTLLIIILVWVLLFWNTFQYCGQDDSKRLGYSAGPQTIIIETSQMIYLKGFIN